MLFDSGWNHMYQDNKHQKPDWTAVFGLLAHLNINELRAYLNDEEKFETMIKDVKELKDIETEKEMVLASNHSLAKFNLSKEPLLRQRKQEIQQLIEEGEKLFNNIEPKSKQILQGGRLETTLALLQTAAAEIEEETEELATKFLDGSLDAEYFREQFLTRRKLMHLKRFNADKMTEMVRKRSSITQTNRSSGSSFYLPPYPLASVPSMLMPSMYSPKSF